MAGMAKLGLFPGSACAPNEASRPVNSQYSLFADGNPSLRTTSVCSPSASVSFSNCYGPVLLEGSRITPTSSIDSARDVTAFSMGLVQSQRSNARPGFRNTLEALPGSEADHCTRRPIHDPEGSIFSGTFASFAAAAGLQSYSTADSSYDHHHIFQQMNDGINKEEEEQESGDALDTSSMLAPPPFPSSPLVVLPGGGMFFYWQLGALHTLSQDFDLSYTHFEGASAGALAGTLAACQVDGYRAAEAALLITKENQVWENPTGLAGIWGPLVREWLLNLLPDNAVELCNHRLFLQILELPSISRRTLNCQHNLVSTFKDKEDLVDCCMASVHIPFFMDGKPWTSFRGRKCVDGSILALELCTLDGVQRPLLVLDYTNDDIMREHRWEFLSLGGRGESGHVATWHWIQTMMMNGGAYIQKLEQEGKLDYLPRRNGSLL